MGCWDRGGEVEKGEGFLGGFVPVAGATFESVECFAEEEECFWRSEGAACRGAADVVFFWGKVTLAEGLDEVTDFGDAFVPDGK